MTKYFLIVLALYGGCYYLWPHFSLYKGLALTKSRSGARWVPPMEYYIGVVYYQKEDYPRAQEAFTQLLAASPTGYYVPRALIYLSDAADRTRDWDVAKAAAARYVEEFPDGKEIELMRKRLEMLKYHHP
ncbi:MAG: outer membrane protein assembly factor BamD [Elusimicrobia bacterium]|nr:outer membrane protein assembly factor BamD [Elusimicrobiota bacterium]